MAVSEFGRFLVAVLFVIFLMPIYIAILRKYEIDEEEYF